MAKVSRQQRHIDSEVQLGTIGSFAIILSTTFSTRRVALRGYANIDLGGIQSYADAATRIMNTVSGLAEYIAEQEDYRSRVADRQNAILREIDKPFEKQARLAELQQRQREIEHALDLTKGEVGAMDEEFKEAA